MILTFNTYGASVDPLLDGTTWAWTWSAINIANLIPAAIIVILAHETLGIPIVKSDTLGVPILARDVLGIPIHKSEVLSC